MITMDYGVSHDAGERWYHRAACKGMDTEIFYPVSIKREHAQEALEICATCPVRAECLADAVESADAWAVLGGTTATERGARRRSTATPEVERRRLLDNIAYHLDRGRTDDEIARRLRCPLREVAMARRRRDRAVRKRDILSAAARGLSLRQIEAELGVGREVARKVIREAKGRSAA